MIKKRKMILLGLVLALVVGLFASNGQASASFLCQVSSSHNTSEEYCYGSLYKDKDASNVKSYCTSGNLSYTSKCAEYISENVHCQYAEGDTCKSIIEKYVKSIIDKIKKLDKGKLPCDSKSGDEKNKCIYGKDGKDNWKYYYSDKTARDQAAAAASGTNTDTDKDKDEENGGTDPAVPTIQGGTQGDCTSILGDDYCNGGGNGGGILKIIKLVISILTGAVVVVGSIGIVICGVLWMTARDNESQIATAKKRLLEIVIGMAAFILFGFLANLLIPQSSEDINKEISVTTAKEVNG